MKTRLKPTTRTLARTHNRPLRRLLLAAACGFMAISSLQAASTGWSGAGPDFNWSTAANWTNGAPIATSDVYFSTDGTVTTAGVPNNTVDADTTIQSLFYHSTNVDSFHTTYINDGVRLTVATTNANYLLNFGGKTLNTTLKQSSAIQGSGGTLYVDAPNLIMNVSEGLVNNVWGTPRYTLDMSDLGTFDANLSRLYVAGDNTYRSEGVLYMAKTNIVRASFSSGPGLLLAQCSTGGAGGTCYLGYTNAFFNNYGIWVAYKRSDGISKLAFNPNMPGGVAYFRNFDGSGRMGVWSIADGRTQAYSGNAVNAVVDFSLGSVDAMVSDVVVARGFNSISTTTNLGRVGPKGSLTFNAGKIDANNVIVSYQQLDWGPRAEGEINVDGTGELIVNNSMLLGHFAKAYQPTNGISSAKLNIGTITGGGSVVVKGPIRTETNPLSDNQSEINIRSSESMLSARNTIGPLIWLELSAGSLSLDVDVPPTAPLCVTSNLITGAGFKVRVQGSAIEPGRITLIDYGSIYSGLGADDLVLVLPPYLQGYLSNNVENSSVDLWITSKTISIWNGDKSDTWDIATTTNWKDNNTGASKVYTQTSIPGDEVLFNDALTGSGNVNLAVDVAPLGLKIANETKAYTFTGSGGLKGPTSLIKSGAGTLTIANSGVNEFTGPVSVTGGTLKLGGSADRLPTNAIVNLDDVAGVKLDLNNADQTLAAVNGGGATGGNVALGNGKLTVTGAGSFGGVISGTGQLIKAGTGTFGVSGANTYSGGTVVSNATLVVTNAAGSGLGSGNIRVEGGTLHLGSSTANAGGTAGHVDAAEIEVNLANPTNTSSAYLWVNRSDDYNLKAVLRGSGQIYLGNGPGRIILDHENFQTNQTTTGYGAVRLTHPNALGSSWMLVGGLAPAVLELMNGIVVTNTIGLNCKGGTLGAPAHVINVSGTNTLAGPINFLTGGSDWVFRSDAGKLLITGPLSNLLGANRNYWLRGDGDGEVYNGLPLGVYLSPYSPTNKCVKDGAGTWTLWGANNYNGSTTVSNGTLLVNGSIIPGALSDRTNVFVYGGTLGGTGTITAPIIVYAGAQLSPGAFAKSVGTLTVNHTLTLAAGSTNLFEIMPDGYDKVEGLTGVVYGGVLKVVLTRSLSGGEVFKLFNAAGYAGAFDSFELPDLGGGLGWDTTQLPVDGTLRVTGGGGKIEVGQTVILADGNFKMTGTSTIASGAYRVLATTNLVDSSSWIEAGTGNFDAGAFSFTDLGATNYAKRYYRIVTP